jgi:hypothetical protein
MNAPVQDSNNTTATASVSFAGAGAVLFWAVGFLLTIGFAVWALERSGEAIDAAKRAEDGAGRAALELRLAQEDLMLLRTALRERGITVESAGDHD